MPIWHVFYTTLFMPALRGIPADLAAAEQHDENDKDLGVDVSFTDPPPKSSMPY